MTTPTYQFTAWHLESWGYRRTPEDPNRLVHVDHGKPGCLFHPITLTSDLNDGQCVLAVLRALDVMHRERIKQLEEELKNALSFIQSVGTEDPDDIESMADIERLSGQISAALSAGQKGAER